MQKSYIAKMQVEENYVQDVVKGKDGWKVKNELKMDDKISVSKFGKSSIEKAISRESMGYKVDTNYNTIWSI